MISFPLSGGHAQEPARIGLSERAEQQGPTGLLVMPEEEEQTHGWGCGEAPGVVQDDIEMAVSCTNTDGPDIWLIKCKRLSNARASVVQTDSPGGCRFREDLPPCGT